MAKLPVPTKFVGLHWQATKRVKKRGRLKKDFDYEEEIKTALVIAVKKYGKEPEIIYVSDKAAGAPSRVFEVQVVRTNVLLPNIVAVGWLVPEDEAIEFTSRLITGGFST